MNIAKNSVVTVEYVLKDKEGNVLDSADQKDPMVYLQGHGNLLPKFESNLEGKKPGDTVDFVISPEDGYGERNEELVLNVPRSQFGGVDEIEPGMQFEATADDGSSTLFSIAAVEGDEVTIDGNPPMAGVELHFSVTVTEVREGTEEEISHGHVHGPDGHHH